MSLKRTTIQVRCDQEVKNEFKAVAAHFDNYEEALKAFIRKYNENPEYFSPPHVY